MPPVYAAFFLWVAAAVLWWSGWREETAGGIPDPAVSVFLAVWPFAAWKVIPLGEGLSLGGSFVWAALAMAALYAGMDSSTRRLSVSASILSCSVDLVLAAAENLPYAPEWLPVGAASLVVGLVCGLLVQGAAGQLSAVTLSLLMYECFPLVIETDPANRTIGGGVWMESWWIAVLSARSAALAAEFLQKRTGLVLWRRKGEGS